MEVFHPLLPLDIPRFILSIQCSEQAQAITQVVSAPNSVEAAADTSTRWDQAAPFIQMLTRIMGVQVQTTSMVVPQPAWRATTTLAPAHKGLALLGARVALVSL